MNLKQLEAFVKVVQQGSFSKAAEVLYTSPTALTQQLNALERFLQCPVLERTYRGVKLTPAGKVFYDYAQEILLKADQAVTACRTQAGLLNKKVTIGCYRENELDLLSPYLKGFAEICPDIEVGFLSSNYRHFFDLLKSRELDMFLHPKDAYIEKNGYCFQKMGNTSVCCSMRKEHPLAQKERISIEDLRGHHIIVSCGCKSRALDNLIAHLKTHEPEVCLNNCTSDEEIWINVFTHGYIMISLDFCYQAPGGCLMKLLDWPEEIEYGIIHRKDDSEAVKRFLSFMRASCEA